MKLPLQMIYNCVCVCVFSGNLNKQTEKGNTSLHYCCIYEKHECLKLLLKGKPATDISERRCLSLSSLSLTHMVWVTR